MGDANRWRMARMEQSLHTLQSQQTPQSLTIDDVRRNYDHLVHDLPHDCRQVSNSGVNFIVPRHSDQALRVFCDQETSGGGWTLIQRRSDGKEDFNRNWADYKSGFGDVKGEFWLGNDQLHGLTGDNTTMLRVDLWDIYGQYWWYSHCQHVNINGKYALGLTWYDSLENEWIALSSVEMKIRDKRIFNAPSTDTSVDQH